MSSCLDCSATTAGIPGGVHETIGTGEGQLLWPPGEHLKSTMLIHDPGHWAIPLRDKILEAGGTVFADEWVHPSDLVAVGLAAAADDR